VQRFFVRQTIDLGGKPGKRHSTGNNRSLSAFHIGFMTFFTTYSPT
jgi:hypothetical protein